MEIATLTNASGGDGVDHFGGEIGQKFRSRNQSLRQSSIIREGCI